MDVNGCSQRDRQILYDYTNIIQVPVKKIGEVYVDWGVEHSVVEVDVQVQEAAAGAVAQVKTSLPAGILRDGQATSVLRFNEDLSTRPAWLPPDCGQPNLALAQWWSSQPEQSSTLGAPTVKMTSAQAYPGRLRRCFWAQPPGLPQI